MMTKPTIRTGVYNLLTDGYRWRHLAFYEKDTHITPSELDIIKRIMNKSKSSYVVYQTQSGGYHVRGLTPLSTVSWAYAFKDLDMDLKGNCSGHTLRVNRKPTEHQLLIACNFDYVCADQITLMTIKQFPALKKIQHHIHMEKWKSLFCIYNNQVAWGFMQRLPPFKRRKQSWQH